MSEIYNINPKKESPLAKAASGKPDKWPGDTMRPRPFNPDAKRWLVFSGGRMYLVEDKREET